MAAVPISSTTTTPTTTSTTPATTTINGGNSQQSSKKSQCLALGGRWDEASQTCISDDITVDTLEPKPLPKVPERRFMERGTPRDAPTLTPEQQVKNQKLQEQMRKETEVERRKIAIATLNEPEPTPAPETVGGIQIIRDQETNLPSAIVRDGVTTFLPPEEIKAIVEKQQAKDVTAGSGVFEASDILKTRQAKEKTAQNVRLLEAAKQGLLTQEELVQIGGADIDWGQAIGGGVIGAGLSGAGAGMAKGVLSGVLGGAVAGAVAGAGAFSVPLAVAGAVFGLANSVKNSIKQQQTEEFAADQNALIKGEKFLKTLISETNQNPSSASENIALFYQTLNLIDAAHAKTKRDADEDLNRWLGNDGTKQLAKFQFFDDMLRNYYISQFETAVMNPDPNKMLLTEQDFSDFENAEI